MDNSIQVEKQSKYKWVIAWDRVRTLEDVIVILQSLDISYMHPIPNEVIPFIKLVEYTPNEDLL